MNEEQEFIHGMINKLTIVNGRVHRIATKSEKLSKEDIVELAIKASKALEELSKSIVERKQKIGLE